jgi:hypothetical protein
LDIERLPVERAFLIAAVRSVVCGNGPIAWPTPPTLLDWATVIGEACFHGVRPQLWRFLEQNCVDTIPADARQKLQTSFQDVLKHNLILTGELCRVTELLKSQGISAIPFKGPTLAMLAYGDLARREFNDLDLLIDARDLSRVVELLASAGYRPRRDGALLSDPLFVAFEREAYFIADRNGAVIDLQWGLSLNMLPFGLGFDHIREHQMTVYPGGQEVPTFRLEDLLLYLCAHGSRHCWERLGWVADIAGLINRHPQLDWDVVLAEARGLRCQRVFLHGLLLARDLMGANLPPAVEQVMRADDKVRECTASILQALEQPLSWSMDQLDLHRYYLKLLDRPADQLRHVLHLIFTPTVKDWKFCPLPTRLTFLYPLVRAIRVIAVRLPFYQATQAYKSSN